MTFVVLYDANVLYPNTLRDLLIRIAQGGLVQAKWTEEILDLPDPGDRHVLAAAIKARAQVIVTDNLKDFPAGKLAAWNVEAKDADAFVLDQIGLRKSLVYGAVQQIADSRHKPPMIVGDVLAELEHNGLLESVAALRS